MAPFSSLMRPVPVLARFAKFVWTTDDTFVARLFVRNGLAEPIPSGTRWRWSFGAKSGWAMTARDVPVGELAEVGEVRVQLRDFDAPTRAELRFGENAWRIYVLPKVAETVSVPKGVVLTENPAVARTALAAGGRVIYIGKGRDSDITSFFPIYWSTGLFPTDHPHIGFGSLIDADHPALAATGCDNWQDEFWRRLFTDGERNAVSYRLRDLPGDCRPLITVVPDLHHSYFISPLFELQVGEGRLLACGLNLDAADPAARLLKKALFDYVASDGFRPATRVPLAWFERSFPTVADGRSVPASSDSDAFVEDMKNKENVK